MYGAGGQKRVPSEFVSNFEVDVPPLSIQRRASRFLDQKTEAIDLLIAKKERLIELLQEKRQALITQAVTKGLSPNAPMKGTGAREVPLLPAHWQIKRLKHLTSWTTSGSRGWATYYSDEGAGFIRIADISKPGIDLDLNELWRVELPDSIEGQRTRVAPGDLLVSITASIGDVGVVPGGVGEAYVSQHVSLSRPAFGVHPRWLAYAMMAKPSHEQLRQGMYGGTKVGLSLSDVREVLTLLRQS